MFLKFTVVLLLYSNIERAQAYVVLRSSGPAVLGANVTLSAIIRNDFSGGERKFVFRNIDRPEYTQPILSSDTVVNYTVELSKGKYEAGFHNFEVNVYSRNRHHTYLFLPYGTDRVVVHVTDLLNGYLKLIQNGRDRSHGNVIPNTPVNHIIKLSHEELQFVTKDNSYSVYWYINCSLIAKTKDLSLTHTYNNIFNTYHLEVVVEVEQDQLSPAIDTTRNDDRLSNFKCAPINEFSYTYGYYRTTIRRAAAGRSQAISSRVSARRFNTRPASYSSVSAIRRPSPSTSASKPWRTTQSSPLSISDDTFTNTSPAPTSRSLGHRTQSTSEHTPWKNGRTTERNLWKTWTTPISRPWSTWTVSKPIPWRSSPTSSSRSSKRRPGRPRGTSETRSWKKQSRTESKFWRGRSRPESRSWRHRGAPKPRILNLKPRLNQRVGPVMFMSTSLTPNPRTVTTTATAIPSNFTGRANNTQTSVKPVHLKIEMDLLFNGTINVDSSHTAGNATIADIKSTIIQRIVRRILSSYFQKHRT